MSQIKIDTKKYRDSYFRNPRGRGIWVFEIHAADSMRYFAHKGLYAEAASKAVKEAGDLGADFRKLVLYAG